MHMVSTGGRTVKEVIKSAVMRRKEISRVLCIRRMAGICRKDAQILFYILHMHRKLAIVLYVLPVGHLV